jgi:hypothetical protein
MGEHIRDTAPPKGETAQAAFKRAYKAVKASQKESKTWEDEAGKVWDQTYGGR